VIETVTSSNEGEKAAVTASQYVVLSDRPSGKMFNACTSHCRRLYYRPVGQNRQVEELEVYQQNAVVDAIRRPR
jgi:hypothetical protein